MHNPQTVKMTDVDTADLADLFGTGTVTTTNDDIARLNPVSTPFRANDIEAMFRPETDGRRATPVRRGRGSRSQIRRAAAAESRRP